MFNVRAKKKKTQNQYDYNILYKVWTINKWKHLKTYNKNIGQQNNGNTQSKESNVCTSKCMNEPSGQEKPRKTL